MASILWRVLIISAILAVAWPAAALVPDGTGGGASDVAAAASVAELGGVLEDAGGEPAPLPQAQDDRGKILLDNYGNTTSTGTPAHFDDAQGFTTGSGHYLLTGVESGSTQAESNARASVVISEPAEAGHPGTTLYTLESPSSLLGRPFFTAPENAYLEPNTTYLVRINVTAGWLGWEFTTNKTETDKGLSGWTFEDHFWTSSGAGQGTYWATDDSKVYALTIWGKEREDDFGEDSFTAGRLWFNRHTGESTSVRGVLNFADDADWFNTSLKFDHGGRYRIDVEPVSLTDDDDLEVRAFYLNNPQYSSGVVAVELESVTDPADGYVSWHFIAGRNYGPYIEVAAEDGTTGEYKIRVVYDPDRTWLGTEAGRGDLYHDDTTWATIVVDPDEVDLGVYHYYKDHDWYAVELEEDANYLFEAIAAGPRDSFIHPAIRLYDGDGKELESDHISHDDESSRSVSIVHRVDNGEGGTYYLDATNAVMWDNAEKLADLGITEPIEIYSPFIGTRYFVLASAIGNRRSVGGAPRNEAPRILNRSSATFFENTDVKEYIKATDSDRRDSITGYSIIGGPTGTCSRSAARGSWPCPSRRILRCLATRTGTMCMRCRRGSPAAREAGRCRTRRTSGSR